MNKTIITVILIAVVAWILYVNRLDRTGHEARPVHGLPWQIETLPNGGSRVFGLTLAESTLDDVLGRFGADLELAVVARSGEAGTLEGYYSDFSAGPLTGKLVLVATVDAGTVRQFREHAAKASYMDSGARKFKLHPDDLPVALQARIGTITYIPSANFDEVTALRHFGTPSERVRVNEHAEHLLYPDVGLDLFVDAKGKEVLQYVAPRDFERLRAPLIRGPGVGDRNS